jgi:hypothetical protein
MTLVMTLCVKDEEDILDAHLAFHLHAGVDFVIATDTGSTDGTLEILDRYRRAGVLELRQDTSRPFRQAPLRTAMARAAAVDLGATWVFSTDVDEFWWPRGTDLKAILEALPPRYGLVFGIWRPFVPRPEDGTPFFERMTYRLAGPHPINDPTSAFRPNVKVAHRAHPAAEIDAGNHSVAGVPFSPLRGWYPIEVLHFPMRAAAQTTGKYATALEYVGPDKSGKIRRAASTGSETGGWFDMQIVDDAALAKGLEAGVVVEDVRLRDTLRTLAPRGVFAAPNGSGPELRFPVPSAVDDGLFAEEVARLGEANLIRTRRTVDELERRLSVVERLPTVRLEHRIRSFARRLRPRT